MPKELLTVVDKPLIQYAAEEAVAAGIDTLVLLQVEIKGQLKIILIIIKNLRRHCAKKVSI